MDILNGDIILFLCKYLSNNDLRNFGIVCKKICKYSLNNRYLWIYKLKEFGFQYKKGNPKYFNDFLIKTESPFYGAYSEDIMNAIDENSYELTEHYINKSKSLYNIDSYLKLAIHKDNVKIINLLLDRGADYKIYETKYIHF